MCVANFCHVKHESQGLEAVVNERWSKRIQHLSNAAGINWTTEQCPEQRYPELSPNSKSACHWNWGAHSHKAEESESTTHFLQGCDPQCCAMLCLTCACPGLSSYDETWDPQGVRTPWESRNGSGHGLRLTKLQYIHLPLTITFAGVSAWFFDIFDSSHHLHGCAFWWPAPKKQ